MVDPTQVDRTQDKTESAKCRASAPPRGLWRHSRWAVSKRENSGAISVAPLAPSGTILSNELEDALDGADAGARGFGCDARARVSCWRRRFRHGAETLSEHRVASQKGQTPERHVFTRPLHELANGIVKIESVSSFVTSASAQARFRNQKIFPQSRNLLRAEDQWLLVGCSRAGLGELSYGIQN